MDAHLLHPSTRLHQINRSRTSTAIRAPSTRMRTCVTRSSSIPFLDSKMGYYKELVAAVDVVERACRLSVDVKSSLLLNDKRVVEKSDQTPVTVADFGVQALISLELGLLFPTIPLVAEEDSAFLIKNNLVNMVVDEVAGKSTLGDETLSETNVLKAIDRGRKDAYVFGATPATYWVLDPIDGTKGFLKGNDALYVVGLALVVDGDVVLGIIGCPNWKDDASNGTPTSSGIVMVSHVGCGTWKKQLNSSRCENTKITDGWFKCSVDGHSSISDARFCISDSQTWDSIPFSAIFSTTTDHENVGDTEIRLVPTCCGSLCKYLMVASGRASIFIQRNKAEKTIKAWDHAVGVICVNEAGGKVSDWSGSELDFAADETERRIISPSGGILVSNGKLHNQILQLVKS